MGITLNKIILQRLAMIKYLYSVAVEQSQKPESLNSISILSFHDAVELFLNLSAEILEVSKGDIQFMGYWDIIDKGLQQKQVTDKLTQKIPMKKLNKARVNLKHYATTLSKLEIEDARVNVERFFDENTPIVFGINFSEISLIDTVLCEKSRKSLEEAEKMLNEGTKVIALQQVALAFAQLIDDYEDRKRGQFGRSPFFFGKEMSFLSSFHMGIDSSKKKLAEFIDTVKESTDALQDAVKILSLGIDYRRYVRFRLLTPHVVRLQKGAYAVKEVNYGSKGIPTVEDVKYCINFVIESSNILQEFDFSLDQNNKQIT